MRVPKPACTAHVPGFLVCRQLPETWATGVRVLRVQPLLLKPSHDASKLQSPAAAAVDAAWVDPMSSKKWSESTALVYPSNSRQTGTAGSAHCRGNVGLVRTACHSRWGDAQPIVQLEFGIPTTACTSKHLVDQDHDHWSPSH